MNCIGCGKQNIKHGHYGNCKKYKDFKNKILNYDFLYTMYAVNNYTANGLAQLITEKYNFKCSAHTIISRCKELGMTTKTINESCKNSKTREKYKNTMLQNHGVEHNFCKNSSSRKEWEQRLLQEEGIINVFQREDVKHKSVKSCLERYNVEHASQADSVKEKSKQTCRDRYEYDHHMKNPEFKQNFIENMCEKYNINNIIELTEKNPINGLCYTSIHKKVVDFLLQNNIPIVIEYVLPIKNRIKNKHYYRYDIYLLNTNKLIEVNGNYWHANPKIYLETDLISYGHHWTKTAAEIHLKDKQKNDFATQNGFEIMVLWEDEINKNFEQIKKRVLQYATTKN
jgi:G:T-mismatch repair DNA endonuclease (very short patch repair protein)